MNMLVKDPKAVPDKWGKRPSDRTVGELLEGGVIALDKPSGPTSHQVTAWAKAALHADRIGHGGTLDPYVSGILPICTGKAVRLTDIVLSSDKEYICLMKLHGDVPEARIREVMGRFQGKIYQLPPVRSAVKRQLRIRTVRELEILDIRGRDVLFRISCDAGTYARTLCIDIGEMLLCGASMTELRRSRSGKMLEADAATLQDLTDAYIFWQQEGRGEWLRSLIKPMEVLVDPLPKIIVKATAVDAVCHGADLSVKGIHMLDEDIRKNALVAMMTARGELIAVGKMMMSSDKIMATHGGGPLSQDVEVLHRPRGAAVPGVTRGGHRFFSTFAIYQSMGFFSKEETVFEQEGIRLGEFDPTNSTGTCYFHVMKFPFDVKKNRMVRVHVVSEKPIDVALASPEGLVGEVGSVTETTLGPYSTKNYPDMCVFLGITPGEKSTVSVKAWLESK